MRDSHAMSEPPEKTKSKKPILVLDLDETLLHTIYDEVLHDGTKHRKTIARPHLHEFLKRMSEIFELKVFTFGCRDYALDVCHELGITNWILPKNIFARDRGVNNPHTGHLQKNLNTILCPNCVSNTRVIDDSPR